MNNTINPASTRKNYFKEIGKYMWALVDPLLGINKPNIPPIIYIIIVILVIVQIILFINACLYYTKYEKNNSENNIPLFEKYPVFEYLKDENFMDIDAFFLKYNSPFPYIFIWYPVSIVLCVQLYKHFDIIDGNKFYIMHDKEHVFGHFVGLTLLFIAYYFVFNFVVDIPIKTAIDNFNNEQINKHIMQIKTDDYKDKKEKILKILKYKIISDMENDNYTLDKDKIVKSIFDQLNDPSITKDNIKNILNADKIVEDQNKISILELIYVYGNKKVVDKTKYIKYIDRYFSLLINEKIDTNNTNYSTYYILGLSSIKFAEDTPTILSGEEANKNFKSIISELNKLLDDTIYVIIKRYYVVMVVLPGLIILLLIVSFWNEIIKAFSYFCREFKLDRKKVIFIAVIVIIILVSFGIQAGLYKDIRNRANADTDDTKDYESAETTERKALMNLK